MTKTVRELPGPQTIFPSHVAKCGLDNFYLVPAGQQVLAANFFLSAGQFSTILLYKLRLQWSPVLEGLINLNESQIVFKAVAAHEDWLCILVCTPGRWNKNQNQNLKSLGHLVKLLLLSLKLSSSCEQLVSFILSCFSSCLPCR